MRNQTSEYKLTIVVPVYNEEDNVANLSQRLADYLPKAIVPACVLMVDDGSSDRSLQLLREECGSRPHFYYISLAKNCGLSAALKAGIDHTESDYVGYIDADLQTDPEDFNLLLAHADNHELVTGIRANRKDSAFKKLQSKIANSFRRMMTGDGVQDTGCPLKVMHTDNAKKIPFFTGLHRFLPAMILMQGGRVMQVPVRHYPRMAGVSKYHLWNRLKGPFMDCFAYRWMKKRYIDYSVAEDGLPAAPSHKEEE